MFKLSAIQIFNCKNYLFFPEDQPYVLKEKTCKKLTQKIASLSCFFFITAAASNVEKPPQ